MGIQEWVGACHVVQCFGLLMNILLQIVVIVDLRELRADRINQFEFVETLRKLGWVEHLTMLVLGIVSVPLWSIGGHHVVIMLVMSLLSMYSTHTLWRRRHVLSPADAVRPTYLEMVGKTRWRVAAIYTLLAIYWVTTTSQWLRALLNDDDATAFHRHNPRFRQYTDQQHPQHHDRYQPEQHQQPYDLAGNED
jgi:hypothetical protein